jgi:hypothetical protein
VAVKGTIGSGEGVLLPTKWHLTGGGGGQDPQQLKELWRRLVDLNEVKMRKKENYGKKYEKYKFD